MNKDDFTPGEPPKKDGRWYEYEGKHLVTQEIGLWVIRWRPDNEGAGKWECDRCTRKDSVWSLGDIQPPARKLPHLRSKYDYTLYERGVTPPYRYDVNPDWFHGNNRANNPFNLAPADAEEEQERILQKYDSLRSPQEAAEQAAFEGLCPAQVEKKRLKAIAQLLKFGRTPRNGNELMHWHLDPQHPELAGQRVYIRMQFCGFGDEGLKPNPQTGLAETKHLPGNQQLRKYRMQTKEEKTGAPVKGQPFKGRDVSSAKIIAVNYTPGKSPQLFGGLEPVLMQPPRRKLTVHSLASGVLLESLTGQEKQKRKVDLAEMSRFSRQEAGVATAAKQTKYRAVLQNAAAERKGKAPIHSEAQIKQMQKEATDKQVEAYMQRKDKPPELLHAIGTRGDANGNSKSHPGTTCIPDDASDPSMTVPDGKGGFVQGGDRAKRSEAAVERCVPAAEAAKWGLLRREDLRFIPGKQIEGISATGPNGIFTEEEWAEHGDKFVPVFFPTVPSLATDVGIDYPFFGANVTARELDRMNRPQCVARTASNPLGTASVWKGHNFSNAKGVNTQEEAVAKELGKHKGEFLGLKAPGARIAGKGVAQLIKEMRPAYEQWKQEELEPYQQRLARSLEQPYYQEYEEWKKRDEQHLMAEQQRVDEALEEAAQWELPIGSAETAECIDDVTLALDMFSPRDNPEPMPEPDPALDPGPEPLFDMVLDPRGDGGQALAMLAGISSDYTKDVWPKLDMAALFKDQSFSDLWQQMTNVRPPQMDDATDGVVRPPVHIYACQNEGMTGAHKNAFVLGYGIYYRPAFEEACIQSTELKTVANLQQVAKQQMANEVALREKVAAKRAAVHVKQRERQEVAKKARDDTALLDAQRAADEEQRKQALSADMYRIEDFHDKHPPAAFYPPLAHRGDACARDFTDEILWRDYAQRFCEHPPTPPPGDASALNGLNVRDGIRFEDANEFNQREAEWLQAKEEGNDLRVPYKPVRHEAAFSVYAGLVGADLELQQLIGLRTPYPPEAQEAASSNALLGGFAQRLAGDRNGPAFGEKHDTDGMLGVRLGESVRIWGYNETNGSDFGKRVKDWGVAKRAAERERASGGVAPAAPSVFVSPQQKRQAAAAEAAARKAKLAAVIAQRKKEMLKRRAQAQAMAAAQPRSPAGQEDQGSSASAPPLVRQRSHHLEDETQPPPPEPAIQPSADDDDVDAALFGSDDSDDDEPPADSAMADGSAAAAPPLTAALERLHRHFVGGACAGDKYRALVLALAEKPTDEVAAYAGDEADAVLSARAEGLALKAAGELQ